MSCRLVLARRSGRAALDDLAQIEDPLNTVIRKGNVHPSTVELLKSIQLRDTTAYTVVTSRIEHLRKELLQWRAIAKQFASLRQSMPLLADELEKSCHDVCWKTRIL